MNPPLDPRALQPVPDRSQWRYHLAFLVLSLGLASLAFGSAFTGRSLLAPLDIMAAFNPHFKWLNPNSDGVLDKHYVIDIFDHELPRQYAIFQAVRQGEFPWWDPYTHSGRSLVAEPHIGATDPIRLALYCTLLDQILRS